jgi:arsenate reductase (thioredoxin)
MVKILFVCWGNVCRSQMAEGFYNSLSKSKDAESAGTEADEYWMKQGMFKEIVDTMNEVGIDIRNQRVKRLTEEMIGSADRVIVLCEKEKCPDFLLKSEKAEFKFIEDPYNKDKRFYRKIRGEIDKLVREILD